MNADKVPAEQPPAQYGPAKLSQRLIIGAFLAFGLFGHAWAFYGFSIIPAAICIALLLGSLVLMMTVDCPRCGGSYFRNAVLWHPFASQCCNCNEP